MNKFFFRAFCLFFMVFSHAIASDTSTCKAIINYTEKNLPEIGVLSSKGGFLHVKVSDEYIYCLIKYIEKNGFEEPPYFDKKGEEKSGMFKDVDLVGAHITVASGKEMKQYGVEDVKECGEKIYFKVTGCEIIQPHGWNEVDELYIITVSAPKLDQIRRKYGLPKTEYKYHITIGAKMRAQQSA